MKNFEPPIRKKNHLEQYDYSTPNAYFITICTHNRENFFWIGQTYASSNFFLTEYGEIAYKGICDISKHYPMISVDNFVIMPNHVHLLLRIQAGNNGRPMAAPTISTVINQTKGSISKQIGFSVWQKGFHDHIIRGENDYLKIWNYIESNPSRWLEDELYQP